MIISMTDTFLDQLIENIISSSIHQSFVFLAVSFPDEPPPSLCDLTGKSN